MPELLQSSYFFFAFITLAAISHFFLLVPRLTNFGYAVINPFLITFFLFIVLLRELAGDTVGYMDYFTSSLSSFPGQFFDKGFMVYTNIFVLIQSPNLYLLSFPIFLFISLYYLYKNTKTNYSNIFVILILLSPMFMGYSITGFRQTLAMCVGIFSIVFLLQKRYFLSLLFIYLSSTFHATGIIYIIPFLVLRFNLGFKIIILIWLIAFIFGYFELLLNIGSLSAIADYAHYFSSSFGQAYESGFRLDFLVFSIYPVVLLAIYLKNSSYQEKQLLKIYIILNAVAQALMFMPYIDRIYAYSWLLTPVIISSMIPRMSTWIALPYLLASLTLFITYNSFWIQ